MKTNHWIIFWFVAGAAFIVFSIIAAINHEDTQAIAWMAYGIACHARCECKILQKRIERLEK